MGEDRTWMPKPDEDKMGWSFGLAVVAGFMAAFSTISMFVYCVIRWYEMNYKDNNEFSFPEKSAAGSSYGTRSYSGSRDRMHQTKPMNMREMSMVPKV